jgi:hypothetical protein
MMLIGPDSFGSYFGLFMVNHQIFRQITCQGYKVKVGIRFLSTIEIYCHAGPCCQFRSVLFPSNCQEAQFVLLALSRSEKKAFRDPQFSLVLSPFPFDLNN